MKDGVILPQMGRMIKDIKEPAEAFEEMIHDTQTGEECGYEAAWMSDH